MPYIFWLVIGAMLLFLELAIPAFICGSFAISAFLIAALSLLGLQSLEFQLAIFALLSPALIFIARRILQLRSWRSSSIKSNVDAIPGQIALVTEPITGPGANGRVSLFGIDWLARSEAAALIAADTKVRVDRVEGITLIVSRVSEGD